MENTKNRQDASNILLFGATGLVGGQVLKLALARGYPVTCFVRQNRFPEREGCRVVTGRFTDTATITGLCKGADAVISCLGNTLSLNPFRGFNTYQQVDFTINRRILDCASAAGVKKFIYVSVFSTPALENLDYIKAHADFCSHLKKSGIPWVILKPAGLFHSLLMFRALARFRLVPIIGDGHWKTNPLSESDLAACCLNNLNHKNQTLEIGGRKVYTRKDLVEIVLRTDKTRAFIFPVPVSVASACLPLCRLLNRRFHALLAFFIKASTTDVVAPAVCNTSFLSYLKTKPRAKT